MALIADGDILNAGSINKAYTDHFKLILFANTAGSLCGANGTSVAGKHVMAANTATGDVLVTMTFFDDTNSSNGGTGSVWIAARYTDNAGIESNTGSILASFVNNVAGVGANVASPWFKNTKTLDWTGSVTVEIFFPYGGVANTSFYGKNFMVLANNVPEPGTS